MSDPLGADKHKIKTVTISSGASTSEAVNIGGGVLVGFICPATIANSAYTVQASFDGGTTFYPVSGLTSLAAAVSTMTSINPADSAGVNYIRLKGTANETADRDFIIVYKAL